jgi:hypothetical protein
LKLPPSLNPKYIHEDAILTQYPRYHQSAPFSVQCTLYLGIGPPNDPYLSSRHRPQEFSSSPRGIHPHAFANYTGPLSSLTGLQAIEATLTASVANVLSQHLLGTIVIDIHKDQKSANSTTYFQARADETWLAGRQYAAGVPRPDDWKY